MYKVFFNDRTVFIGSTFKKSLIKDEFVFHVTDLEEMESAWLVFRNDHQERDLFLIVDDPEKGKIIFFSLFEIVDAAGGMVSNSDSELLAIFRWGKWDLPKGKAEKGERMDQTALREVEEECGICNLINHGLNTVTYHIYEHPRKKDRWILKQTFWFNMTYKGDQNLVPQINEDIIEARWFSKKEVEIVIANTWASLKPLIAEWANSV